MTGVTVLGAGGWGTALAAMLGGHGIGSVLWARDPEFAEVLREQRENRRSLPGVPLPPGVEVTADLGEALAGRSWALLTVPSVGMPGLLEALPRPLGVVLCAKGLGEGGERLSLLAQRLGFGRVAVLSGPNHAEEVGRGLPAATVVASTDPAFAAEVQAALMTPSFRVYTSSDVPGVELGGVLKNPVALAAGLLDGLELGDNAKAALITRGLLEMGRYLATQGARPETVYGLSGLGDLMATAGSRHSRNRAAGEAIARGRAVDEGAGVVEGVRTARLLGRWAREHGGELPIVGAVDRILSGEWTPQQGVADLMGREGKSES